MKISFSMTGFYQLIDDVRLEKDTPHGKNQGKKNEKASFVSSNIHNACLTLTA